MNEKPGNPCKSMTNIDFKTPINTVIATLNADDNDNEILIKQTISYKLETDSSPFVVIGKSLVVNEVCFTL